jgi:SAM-dependent methyltransferase
MKATAVGSSVLSLPWVSKVARRTADWIDLQWSITIESLTRIAPRSRGRLLDVGCGDKPYEHLFSPFVDEYVGIEHEASFVATSASSGKKGPDHLYDGNRLPFEDRTFDTVLSVQVLEHTPRPGPLVREMARVLKNDGLLILTAPFQFRLHEEPHDYFRYTHHGLRELCREAGLEIIEVEQQGSLWSVMGHKLNSYLGLNVARLQGVAQAMGKLGHEDAASKPTRWWTLPVVAPAMATISLGARVLDRVAHDRNEALSFLIVARRAK